MSILNRWRQIGKRYFWPHLLLGVVAASFGAPSILGNNEQQAVLSTSTSVNQTATISPEHIVRQEFSRQSVQSVSIWHQQAIRRFLTKLAFAISPQINETFSVDEEEHLLLSVYDWPVVNTLTELLLSNQIAHLGYSIENANYHFPVQQKLGLWLVKLGGLRAGPLSSL